MMLIAGEEMCKMELIDCASEYIICEVEGMRGYDLIPSDQSVRANEDNCSSKLSHR